MANDVLDPIKELDQLRWNSWHAREDAKAKGDDDSVAKLTQLLVEIHDAREDAVFEILGGIAAKLADFTSRLAKIVAWVKSWPFGVSTEHEKQFHDETLPDNDFEDEGPDTAPVEPAPVPAEKVPVVSAAWAENYQTLWDTMTVTDDWQSKAVKIAKDIVSGQAKYAAVVSGTNVPWWFVGIVHSMECGLNFTTHLHNGDPLTDRTQNVPSGRPPVIQGLPIDWVFSARDAITYEKLDKVADWSLPSVLYHWHRYNGINNEYKKRHIPTPYLWSGSQHYIKGKYDLDGHFNPGKPSKQVGAAVLLWALIKIKAVIPGGAGSSAKKKAAAEPPTPIGNPAAAAQHVASLDLDLNGTPFKHLAAELTFPGELEVGSTKQMAVKRVQEWLNLHGFVTSIDSDFGPSTQKQLGRFATANGRPAGSKFDDELWALLTAPLRKALAPIPALPSLEAAVVNVAKQHIAQMPTEVGGNNCGPWVRAYMRGKEGSDWKWCGGFVSLMIEQATRDLGVDIDFKRQVGVDELVDDAKKAGRFIRENEVSTPLLRQSKLSPGYLFVVRGTATNWTHVGIVSSVMPQTFDTLEGNTGGDGGTDGPNARKGNRSYPDRDFIRLL
ncbi:hypothetical protein [Rhizobium ruizarguesonis]|uniref:hypothetical protein n=1 Tax=Rhizobium ruizarguesonis TaxID=2081791 RepID=UPI0013DEDB89|nr:hypothetical protein [Rhizobium ruizarguesonis]NEJ94331.1 hypothetical protein [Rhizobium ruizarguesonis]